MVDSVIAGTGNSRYLRTSIGADTTWAEALEMLRAGTFPIDLAGINQAGFSTLGTALNSDTLLKSAVIIALGLDSDATPSDAWEAVLTLIDAKADADSAVTAVTYDTETKTLSATINGTSTAIATFDFVNAEEASAAAPVQSVAGKTGTVALNAGDVTYDETATYNDGTVGAVVTDLQDQLLSVYPTDTASGSIASFADGADDVPVRSLTVSIAPVQNLNGYDNPWPAGGGKNLLDMSWFTTRTVNGVTFTKNSDGSVTLSGTASSTININGTTFTLPAGTYTISGSISNNQLYLYDQGANTAIVESANGTTRTVTTAEDKTVYLRLRVGAGTAVSGTVKPQLESGSTPTAFSPYSNICPITGWDSAKVNRTGRNLLQPNEYTRTLSGITWTFAADGSVHVSGTAAGNVYSAYGSTIRFTLPAGTYTLSGIVAGSGVDRAYLTGYALSDQTKTTVALGADTGGGGTFTIAEPYMCYYQARVLSGVTVDATFYPQLQPGSTATPYEPYNATSITLQLGQTVYGGTLDVVTGVLTVDKGIFTVDSSTTIGTWLSPKGPTANIAVLGNTGEWASDKFANIGVFVGASAFATAAENSGKGAVFGVLNSYNRVYFWMSSASTNEELKQFLIDLKPVIVYPLATPQTIQLTPQEINSFLGPNNIWADAGDVEVTYRADVGLYVNKKTAQTLTAAASMLSNAETDMTATRAYAVNDFLSVNGQLYRVTAAIANGATITPGTNVTETTVGAQITALLNA